MNSDRFHRTLIPVLLLSLGLIALACGGGSEDTGTASSDGALRIKLVYPQGEAEKPGRNKFAIIDRNAEFRIGTDLSEDLVGGDPKHATHAVAEFWSEGNVVSTGVAELLRSEDERGIIEVERASRTVTLSSVPTGVLLDFNIRLGRDIDTTEEFEALDPVYYTGSVNNIVIVGGNVVHVEDGVIGRGDLDDENQENTLFVELAPSSDGGNYSKQFYGDFSKLPFVVGSDCVILDPEAQPLVSINSVYNTGVGVASRQPFFLTNDVFDFQAFFFEASGIPLSGAPYDVFIESGAAPSDAFPGVNLLLGGLIVEEDLISGRPLLFDFETSFVRVMSQLHEFIRPSGNMTAVYEEMTYVYDRLEPLIEPENDTGHFQYHPGDIATLELAHAVATLLLVGSKFDFQRADKFHTKIFLTLPLKSGGDAINYFSFSGNRNIPLTIRDSDRGVHFNIPSEISGETIVDFFGNVLSVENGNVGSANTNLADLYKGQVVDYYFLDQNIWNYLDSITDLDEIEPRR